jgi:raffinose/stachyose/melibiose transport system permease protein
MVIVCLSTLYPVFFIYNNAIKSKLEISKSFFNIAKGFDLTGIKFIFFEKQGYRFLLNTFIVVAGALAICLFISILVAFRLSRFNIKFGNGIYIFFLMGIILSHQTSIVPIFIILRKMHLVNNLFGLILAFSAWNLSLTILILTAFFRSIPKELQDAARIDGCTNFGFLFRIMIPLSKASIATATILATVFIWNDLMFPLTLMTKERLKTVAVSLIYFKGEYFSDYSLLFSGISFMILPLIILYIAFQKYFVSGALAGSIKE